MISVQVSKQASYPVSSAKIKKFLKDFFAKNGIVSDAQVSVAIIGEKKMLEIGHKFMKDKKLHNVLSFTEEETRQPAGKDFVYPPGVIFLGEIILCYPKIVSEAKLENKRVEDKLLELAEHAGWHLLGVHHA